MATRYEKTARNFLSAVHVTASRFLLRKIVNQMPQSAVVELLRGLGEAGFGKFVVEW